MPEMGFLVRQMMHTLREAQHAIGAELDVQTSASSPDAAFLVRLHASAAEFAHQARALIVVMQERSIGEALISEADR